MVVPGRPSKDNKPRALDHKVKYYIYYVIIYTNILVLYLYNLVLLLPIHMRDYMFKSQHVGMTFQDKLIIDNNKVKY